MKTSSTILMILFVFASCSSGNKAKQLTNEKLSEESMEELNTYFEENDIDAQMTESGLCYVIEKEGTGAQAEAGKKVSVHYTGKFKSGQTFDSSHSRNKPLDFTLGVGQVIKGWDEGIALFKEGGKGTLYIPYELGYGERGGGPIPPKSMLIFDIELIKVY